MTRAPYRTLPRVAAFVLLLLPFTQAKADVSRVGRAVLVQNSVTALSDQKTRYLSRRAPIYLQETLQSHDSARLEAMLLDETKITMGENAVLRIEDFVYDPGAGGGRLSLQVLDGAMLFVGGGVEAGPGSDVRIKTSFATVGVRGTTFWAGPLDGAFAVLVLDGSVTVSNAGRTVTLGRDEGTTIADTASPPQNPVVWGAAKVARALAAVGVQQ